MNKKTTYPSQLPQRHSIRLRGYDYAQSGRYFVTICCQHRACLFGEIVGGSNVGADLRVGPNHENVGPDPISGEHVLKLGERDPISGEHIGSPLHRMVQWFKTMTTNEYIHGVKQHHGPPFDGKLWQRNYYEHIIRDELSFEAISSYIIQNPANWITYLYQ